ncbi:uroporphyrinogen-III C-methyltransferase [Cytobacillus sp. FJAT-54145]|uniref:uroporphyrinogen-III C-methyltransferase n=1 Tax=Cytobacillus spartinae TaxID=3299023 RepID=A0ABW6K938_9BACI
MGKGKAFLVGAGPGDIGLITVKGLEAIKSADVILYDRLANPKLLDFASSDAELIYCGKLPHRHILRQEAINDLLVSKALEGKIVVRLKGGDPGVFGRVGEEAEKLAAHDIPYEMVPGITSGIAAPLQAGIPVTHREFGESFAVVTAHDKSDEGKPLLNWVGLATGVDTIAFYMGVSNLPYICENLMKYGRKPETPVILIQWGTYGRQKTLEGTLSTIAKKVAEENFKNPAITLVGDIVSLRSKLAWFERKPLYGRQILLPRTGTNESELAKALINEGADVIEFPKWKQRKVRPDKRIMSNLHSYEKILFSSPECVTEFFEMIYEEQIDIRMIDADFYGRSRKSVEELKKKFVFAKLADEMPISGKLLIVGDNKAYRNKVNYTVQYGTCDFLIVNELIVDEQFIPIFQRMLEEASLDSLIFPSSESVRMFVEDVVEKGFISASLVKKLDLFCMGERTKKTAELYGFVSKEQPEVPTIESMLDLLTINRDKVNF